MVKTVQTIVHRLKDEETNEESGRDMNHEDQQVVNKDMGVKVRNSAPRNDVKCWKLPKN